MVQLISAAVIALVVGLGAAVSFIHKGAVARLEADRLMTANRVQKSSVERVQELSASALLERDERIEKLQFDLSTLPVDTAGQGTTCPAACSLIWESK